MDKIIPLSKRLNKIDFSTFAEDFVLTDEQAEAINDPEWIIENLVIRGHVSAFPAEPNAGKTTIFSHIAGDMVAKGYKVFYINADISGSDIKAAYKQAKALDYKLMLPDFKGKTTNEVMEMFEAMAVDEAAISDHVFIIDTLKKFTDVIVKNAAKDAYNTFRKLSSKGATVILLSHTNKYKGEDGKPIFEGTGDLRADVDELIYLIPFKNQDGSITVSTGPDKVRGKFKPITFQITSDRKVITVDYVDTVAERQTCSMLANDKDGIEVINNAIESDKSSKVDIMQYCEMQGIGRRKVIALLRKYASSDSEPRLWNIQHVGKNEHKYTRI